MEYNSRTRREDLYYLCSVLGLESHIINSFLKPIFENLLWVDIREEFLGILERRAQALLSAETIAPSADIDYERIQRLLASLVFNRLEKIRAGLDFNLELRLLEPLITEESYPALFDFCIRIPGDRGFGVERERHGDMGYHIHYVRMKKRRHQRTDVVFTFNPIEPPGVNDTLFWYHHGMGKGIHQDPGQFGKSRCQAIYDCSTPFLNVVHKSDFMRPPRKAIILYP